MASFFKYSSDLSKPYFADKKRYKTDANFYKVTACSCWVYIGNLAFTTNEAQVRHLMESCGAIEHIVMGVNKETGEAVGFCIIEFVDRAGAIAAVNHMHGAALDGRRISVEMDKGFRPKREFGRAESGLQIRDEFREGFDAGRGGFGGAAVRANLGASEVDGTGAAEVDPLADEVILGKPSVPGTPAALPPFGQRNSPPGSGSAGANGGLVLLGSRRPDPPGHRAGIRQEFMHDIRGGRLPPARDFMAPSHAAVHSEGSRPLEHHRPPPPAAGGSASGPGYGYGTGTGAGAGGSSDWGTGASEQGHYVGGRRDEFGRTAPSPSHGPGHDFRRDFRGDRGTTEKGRGIGSGAPSSSGVVVDFRRDFPAGRIDAVETAGGFASTAMSGHGGGMDGNRGNNESAHPSSFRGAGRTPQFGVPGYQASGGYGGGGPGPRYGHMGGAPPPPHAADFGGRGGRGSRGVEGVRGVPIAAEVDEFGRTIRPKERGGGGGGVGR